MSYTINGTIYTLKELDDMTKKYKGDCELQEAALEIMESIAEEE